LLINFPSKYAYCPCASYGAQKTAKKDKRMPRTVRIIFRWPDFCVAIDEDEMRGFVAEETKPGFA
jgi:hypothetical protein